MLASQLAALPYDAWKPTKETLHLWTQIVGKIRLMASAHRNQWWNVTLLPTSQGLAARGMRHNGIDFELEFDFIEHRLVGRTDAGRSDAFALRDGLSVADFYAQTQQLLRALALDVPILASPYGVPMTTPFAQDREHRSYDRDAVVRWWNVVLWTAAVFDTFASEFAGKQSPAHIFWHTFDLAMSRYNGKSAPQRPGATLVEREAYAFEVIAFGFWPGDERIAAPTYYTYTVPEPETLVRETLRPAQAAWGPSGSGHIGALAYEAVRTAGDPDATLLDFLRSSYEAGTRAAGWDVAALQSRFPM